jgi:hypothetical protein
LFQGGQSAEVDGQGRIYISNLGDGAGLVRFNPHTAKFEQPPLNLVAELRKFIPPDGDVKRNWDIDLSQLVVHRERLYIVFDRNYRVRTPNGIFDTCNGVVSLPLEHWDDAAAFGRELRLHAAPREPDQAIGVCEYAYYYSKLDHWPDHGAARVGGHPGQAQLGQGLSPHRALFPS